MRNQTTKSPSQLASFETEWFMNFKNKVIIGNRTRPTRIFIWLEKRTRLGRPLHKRIKILNPKIKLDAARTKFRQRFLRVQRCDIHALKKHTNYLRAWYSISPQYNQGKFELSSSGGGGTKTGFEDATKIERASHALKLHPWFFPQITSNVIIALGTVFNYTITDPNLHF